jgi:hypothetical protein
MKEIRWIESELGNQHSGDWKGTKHYFVFSFGEFSRIFKC